MLPRMARFRLASRLGDDTQVGGSVTSEVDDLTVPKNADSFWIQSKTSGVILSFDGSSPTQTNGLRVPAGAAPCLIPFVPLPGQALRIASDDAPTQADYTVVWTELG